jgi:hypothetical protein
MIKLENRVPYLLKVEFGIAVIAVGMPGSREEGFNTFLNVFGSAGWKAWKIRDSECVDETVKVLLRLRLGRLGCDYCGPGENQQSDSEHTPHGPKDTGFPRRRR